MTESETVVVAVVELIEGTTAEDEKELKAAEPER
jgi:hypothetical protein